MRTVQAHAGRRRRHSSPGKSGYLDVVELSANGVSGRFQLTVEGVNEAGEPDGTPLATAVVDGIRMTDVTAVRFFPAANVTSGTPYALVLSAEDGNLPGTSADMAAGNQAEGARCDLPAEARQRNLRLGGRGQGHPAGVLHVCQARAAVRLHARPHDA